MSIRLNTVLLAAGDVLWVNLALGLTLALAGHVNFSPALQWGTHLFATLAAGSVYYTLGLYRRLWRFAGLPDYLVLLRGLAWYALICFLAGTAAGFFPEMLPALVVFCCVTGFLTTGWRLLWRLAGERRKNTGAGQKRPAMVVGAGGAGLLVARTLLDNCSSLQPVCFVDDDREKQGMWLAGLPIAGTSGEIPQLAEQFGIEEIIIAIPSAAGEEIRRIVELSRNTRARLKILPSVYRIIGGKIPADQIRDIQVEDLLNRMPVQMDTEAVGGYIRGRVVMVTGAGGSVGSELCRQLARFAPQALVLLGRGENSIYEVNARLAGEFPKLCLHAEIADVRDRARVEAVMDKYRPAVIFHAAAHKHVPLMEHSPAEAFKNNVLGTYNLARAALSREVETFILISTDKAVNPTSVMGATKRIAELLVLECNQRGQTRFAAVRFGNVLGSRGSVIPVFKKQIAAGGPVTVTHPDMVRFFMTVSEAAQLVIEAGAMARGGEIFVLDMGKPVRIVDLAMNMIKLSGYRPEKDIAIQFTGIRPGEKLYEELFGRGEQPVKTAHEKIFTVTAPAAPGRVGQWLEKMDVMTLDDVQAGQIIKRLVEYAPPAAKALPANAGITERSNS